MSSPPALELLLAAAGEQFDPYAEQILQAARSQFIEHGLRRTSLDDIAKAANVSRTTLFRRFPNRDALTFALMAREVRAAIAAIDERVANIDDPEQLLVTGGHELIRQLTANQLAQRLVITDPEELLPLLTTGSTPILTIGAQYLASYLKRLRDAGAPIPGDIDILSEIAARTALSMLTNPNGSIPIHDPDALEHVLRTTIIPMIIHP